MKKRFLAILATGLFFGGLASIVQADTITIDGDYNSLFGKTIDGFVVANQGSLTNTTTVYDTPSYLGESAEIIGYKGDTFSGIYIGTITETGNESAITEASMNSFISYFLGTPFDAELFIKTDATSAAVTTFSNTVEDIYGYGVTLSFTPSDSEFKIGTWSLIDENPSLNYAINFYGVKGSKEWSLYFVDPAAIGGSWTTGHLLTPPNVNDASKPRNVPGISHFAGSATSSPVPEPGTVLLFGTGLAGLAAVGRRRKN